MRLSEELRWRGLIKDKTFDDISWLDKPKVFYHGIDASENSMTIGNLAALMTARRLMDAGWRAVLLTGGATSLIGDPKDTEERALKPREEIEANIKAVKKQINRLFAGQNFISVDNYDWFKEVNYLDFLRDIGKNYAMTELMQREFVIERLSSGISYAEFSYSLIQGYDYWQLYKNHNVVLQIGGSDQWGNMLSGVSLVRKKEAKDVQALSMPLVVDKTTGRKFGKSESGAIWLDDEKTSVYKFYQFWFNAGDEDVIDYLKIFTLLGKDEIQELAAAHKKDPSTRSAQRKLAYEITGIVHGQDQAAKQEHIAQALFGEGKLDNLDNSEITTVRQELPSLKVQPGSSVIEVLVETGLASSNSEARRLLESKAIYVNNIKIDKPHLDATNFKQGRLMLRRGKAYKDSALIELA